MTERQQRKMTPIQFSDTDGRSNSTNSYKIKKIIKNTDMSKKFNVSLIPRYEGTSAIEYEKLGQPSVKQDYTNSFRWHIVNPKFKL